MIAVPRRLTCAASRGKLPTTSALPLQQAATSHTFSRVTDAPGSEGL